MPDWKAPFHFPRITNDKFIQLRKNYVAKYGYTVTYPTLEDFIRIKITAPITIEEQQHWVKKDFTFFTPDRLEEIAIHKKRRKAQFQRLLSSPSPDVFRARGSVIGAIDDAEDALSTLAALGRLAVKIVSPAIATLISGPVGWLMRTSALLNMATSILTPEVPKRITKRQMDSLTALNPKTRKASWKRAQTLSKQGFTGGDILQLAQTTDQVFGIGISLGAFMAFPIDFLSGVARGVAGQPIQFSVPAIDIPYWHVVAKKALKGLCCMLTAPSKEFIPAFDESLLSVTLAAQIDSAFAELLNPLDTIPNPSQIEVQAPTITNLVTREAITEVGHNPDEGIAWPCTGKQWSTYTEISNNGHQNATKNFNDHTAENNHSYTSFLASCNAVESTVYLGEAIAGRNTVTYDFTAPNKFIHSLAWADYAFPHYYNIAQHSPGNLITEESIKAATGNVEKPPFPMWIRPHGNIQDLISNETFHQTNYTNLVDLAKKLQPFSPPEDLAKLWLVNFFHEFTQLGFVWNHLNNLGRYLEALEQQGQNPNTGDIIKNSKETFGFPFIYAPTKGATTEIP